MTKTNLLGISLLIKNHILHTQWHKVLPFFIKDLGKEKGKTKYVTVVS